MGRFKFCNFWIQDPQYHDIVVEGWNESIDGIPMYKVVQKLKLLKKKPRGLHRTKYSYLCSRLKAVKGHLDDTQTQLQQNLDCAILQKRKKEAYDNYLQLASAELSLFKQNVKAEWVQGMDQNTSYFHAKVSEKQSRSRICISYDDNGRLVEDMEQISELFIKFSTELLGSSYENLLPVDTTY